MRVNRQVQYALYGVFDLAYNGEDRPIPVQEIGDRQRLPARYLEQILQRLRRAGLVESKRGPGGGYALARPPSATSRADILIALEGSVLEPAEAGPKVEGRPEFVWGTLEERVSKLLRSISLLDLCEAAAQRGVPRAEAQPAMYHI
jgi:Rrf2 family protein